MGPSTKSLLMNLYSLNLKISAEQIIAHCCKATHVLQPVHACAETLEETPPIHTARYHFRLPDIGPVRLDVEVNKPLGLDMYEISRKQWTRSPNDADLSAQRSLLELHMVRLQEYQPTPSVRTHTNSSQRHLLETPHSQRKLRRHQSHHSPDDRFRRLRQVPPQT